jgi:RimJ/RimL family protein N-acetyltransferase
MAQNITIRALGPGDVDEFSRVRLESLILFPRSFWESPDEFRAKSRDMRIKSLEEPQTGDRFILGAFIHTALIGTVGLSRETGIKGRHRAMIWGMYVNPDHQGKGIGTKLLQAAIERAHTLADLEVLFLFVAPENLPAVTLYKSCGFQSYGVEPYSMKLEGTFYDEEMMYFKFR